MAEMLSEVLYSRRRTRFVRAGASSAFCATRVHVRLKPVVFQHAGLKCGYEFAVH